MLCYLIKLFQVSCLLSSLSIVAMLIFFMRTNSLFTKQCLCCFSKEQNDRGG
jgi:hypothetical protein